LLKRGPNGSDDSELMRRNDDEASAERALPGSAQPFSAVYAAHASQVRRHLFAFGARPSDLDDLSQEVFLVVMDKGEAWAQIERIDLWLREICRKVAAGHRRRGGRQREVPVNDSLEALEDGALTQSAVLEQREDTERLHRAIHALDEEARDLIAMHELGGLPLVDLATLVDRDRKTVRKRLEEANRRLIRLFREHSAPRAGTAGLTRARVALPSLATSSGAHVASSQLLAQNSEITIGVVGSVLVAVWPGRPTLDALELLDQHMQQTSARLGNGLVYLAIVEASTSTPTLEARQKITSMMKRHTPAYELYPHVLLGGFSWIVRPIMSGLALLAGIPSVPFFGSLERAAAWLASNGSRAPRLDLAALIRGANELRESAASNSNPSPR
jgi:RNA polymerase sigma factor (sigma-70 family)